MGKIFRIFGDGGRGKIGRFLYFSRVTRQREEYQN